MEEKWDALGRNDVLDASLTGKFIVVFAEPAQVVDFLRVSLHPSHPRVSLFLQWMKIWICPLGCLSKWIDGLPSGWYLKSVLIKVTVVTQSIRRKWR